MASTFKYQAKDSSGKTVSGTMTAETQQEVVADLRRRALMPVNIKKSGGGGFLSMSLSKGKGKKKATRSSAKKGELEEFTRQLSTMLSAGIPLLEGLEILADQAESAGFRFCLHRVVEDIRNGADLSAAMEPHSKVFSDIYVSMIRAGEISGQLDIILTRLAEYIEAAAKLRSEIKSAMTYPVVSLFMVIGIASFLLIGVVPSFGPIFDSLDVELPALTVFTMQLAFFMRDYWYVIFGAAGAIFYAAAMYKKTDKGAYVFDFLFLKMPVFGPLFKKVALARFSRTFSTLIKSGVPILGAMEIVSQTAGNRVISRVVDAARESVKQGDTLSDPFSKSNVFPPMVVKMMGIGERSGALDALLEKIAEFYDQQVETEVKGLTSLIEPIMIGVMGFIVGGIVLAVFLPIFKMQEALSK